jgi:hypothetical protein
MTGYNRLLGLAYGRVKNRVMNNLQLAKTAETSGHGNRWVVVDHRPTAPVGDVSRGETAESDGEVTGERGDRIDRSLVLHEEKTIIHDVCVSDEKSSGAEGVLVYPLYPIYPPADPPESGADPLASLLPLCAPVPDRLCPDCDAVEELTPSGLWLACRSCHPHTFDQRP